MLLDPVQQRKANPSLDAPGCPTSEELTQAVIEAKNSPRKINNLLRYRFDIPTAQIDRIVNMEAWKRCRTRLSDMPDLRGMRCFGGLDLASVEDITAYVLVFPPAPDERDWIIKAWFWCPEEKMREREQRQMTHYTQWAKDGWLKITPGKRIDYRVIVADIQEILETYDVEESGYDKWNAEAAIQELELDSDWVEVNQSIRGMTLGTKALLDMIESEKVIHDDNPVLTWCLGNASADRRSNEEYIKFSKEDSSDKIDGAVAAAMACGLAVLAPEEQPSIYNQPGGAFL
jgi:phage terminase large subunit-like protein